MCGIIYIEKKGKTDIENLIKNAYEYQKTRGKEGFGFVVVKNDNTVELYRAKSEDKIMELLKKIDNEKTKAILFHHRYPTSTPNYIEATHPIEIKRKDKTYYVVHNGIISNDDDLRELHSSKGLIYSTEITTKVITRTRSFVSDICYNDSETIAYDFVLFLEEYIKEIRAKGSMAIMCLEVDNKTQKATNLYYFRNAGNELIRKEGKNYIQISSENKKGKVIETNTLYCKDLETGITSERFIKLDSYKTYSYTVGFNGYDDYTYETENYYAEMCDDDLQRAIIDLESEINAYKLYQYKEGFEPDEMFEQEAIKNELNIAKAEYENRKADF